jgi:hypothetical protein
VSTAPGQAGTTTYRWDIGFDLSNRWFADPATINASVDKAIDMVDLDIASLMDLYETDALLRPASGRVIIRAAASQDPYAANTSNGDALASVKTQWHQHQADANVDDVAVFNGLDGGGGVAWIGEAGTTMGLASIGGKGDPIVVLRHELGHTWGPYDNHTNGPEGATIQSGNQFERFDGTELSAVFRYRDSREVNTAPFTPSGVFSEPVPPYAALDLVDDQMSTVAHRFRPTANDHDANADALTLDSVQSTSRLSGSVTMSGDVLTYTPPTVSAADTLDWVQYVVRDATGKTATGVSLFLVDPYVTMPDSTTWPAASVPTSTIVEIRNSESGLYASVPNGAIAGTRPVQAAKGTAAAQWRLIPSGAGYLLQNVATGLCIDTPSYQITLATCADAAREQWKAVQHPRGGISLLDGRWNKCLKPTNGAIDAGATLGYAVCSQQLANIWSVTVPPVSEWPAAPAPGADPQHLVNLGAGLTAGLPVGSTAWTHLVLRTDGVGDTFGFTSYGDGSWKITETGTGACVDDYGSVVGTYGCHGGSNQHWKLLQNPAGGASIVGADTNKCLATAGGATAAGTELQVVACSTAATQRWAISP